MNSPLLALVVIIVIVIGATLTTMNRACKTAYHAWCAPNPAWYGITRNLRRPRDPKPIQSKSGSLL